MILSPILPQVGVLILIFLTGLCHGQSTSVKLTITNNGIQSSTTTGRREVIVEGFDYQDCSTFNVQSLEIINTDSWTIVYRGNQKEFLWSGKGNDNSDVMTGDAKLMSIKLSSTLDNNNENTKQAFSEMLNVQSDDMSCMISGHIITSQYKQSVVIGTFPDGTVWAEVIDAQDEEEDKLYEAEYDDEPFVEDLSDLDNRNDDGSLIQLNIVYTGEALCQEANLDFPCDFTASSGIINRIAFLINEGNQILRDSQSNLQMEVVRAYRAEDYTEGQLGFPDTLTAMQRRNDGVFETPNLNDLRDSDCADIVGLITANGEDIMLSNGQLATRLGRARGIGPSSFFYTFVSCLDSRAIAGFTFTHEVGHLLGCRHDIDRDDNPPQHAHGYLSPPAVFRYSSIMTTRASCPRSSCERLPVFSNPPPFRFNNLVVGNPQIADNVRRIQETRLFISNLRDSTQCRATPNPTASTPNPTASTPLPTPAPSPQLTTSVPATPSPTLTTAAPNSGSPTTACPTVTPGTPTTAAPGTPAPSGGTVPPTPTLPPTSITCDSGTGLFQLDLVTDSYGEDVSWTVVNNCNSMEVSSGSGYASNERHIEEQCLDLDQQYTFTILDSFGDGICCSYGNGEYTVYFNGDFVREGGENLSEESAVFGESCPGQQPTSPPTAEPTPPLTCPPGTSLFLLRINFDSYAEDISWTLANRCTASTVISGGNYPNGLTGVIEQTCIEDGFEYTFAIRDSFGDGICCTHGNGEYSISLDGEEQKSGGNFGGGESHTFVSGSLGAACTPAPTPQVTLPPQANPTGTLPPVIAPTLFTPPPTVPFPTFPPGTFPPFAPTTQVTFPPFVTFPPQASPTSTPPPTGGLGVGDYVCTYGFIMDSFCIDRGTLLDNPNVVSLRNPELHSLHCLLDVPPCVQSPFHILEPPAAVGADYGPGWAVNDNAMLVEEGRKAGSPALGCNTCVPNGGDQQFGYRAEVTGTVASLEPPVLAVTGVTTLNEGEVGCSGNAIHPPS